MRHVTGYTWRDGAPLLRWRSPQGQPGEKRLMGPLHLALHDKRCVGFRKGSQHVACPEERAVTGKQCPRCQAADEMRPCLTCDGFRCPSNLPPQVERSCLGHQHLYLACFGAEPLKVGTASHSRRIARPVEQGPLAVAWVASGPGRHIKQLEHLLSSQTELTEHMQRSQKLRLLASPMGVEEARDLIVTTWARVRTVLRDIDEPLCHDTPQFVPLPPIATRTREALAGVALLPLEEGRLISGEVIGGVGHLALLEEPAGRFLLDLGALTGHRVDPDPPRGLKRPRVQLSLL